MITGDNISLRAVEPADVDFMFDIENDQNNWLVSQTTTPFSRNTLKAYAESVHDITLQKQLRLIVTQNAEAVGCVDLFDYDPIHARCGVGIIILENYRGQGLAKEVLNLIADYAFKVLHLHQLWCQIPANNKPSIALFESSGFEKTGERKDWIKGEQGWINEIFYQKLNA